MKKTNIFLSAAFALAIASCQNQEDTWIKGYANGQKRDTSMGGKSYRHYNGMWYPIMHGGMISPSTYHGYSTHQISQPGFTPARSVTTTSSGTRTGGFGHSSSFHSSFGG